MVFLIYLIVSMEVLKLFLEEKEEESRRNGLEYGLVGLVKVKKEKVEKVKKGKGKGKGEGVDGDGLIFFDVGFLVWVVWFRVVLDEV